MHIKILLLRISYWWGIIADAVMAVLMLFPNLFLRFMKINLTPGPGFNYGLLYGVPLMVGWTILLIWADRKPVDRRDILPLTLPVVAGYFMFEAYCIITGLTALGQMLPLFVAQAGMSSMFIFSYLNTRTLISGVGKA